MLTTLLAASLSASSFSVAEVTVRELWDRSTLVALGRVEQVERIPREVPGWPLPSLGSGGFDGRGATIARVRMLRIFRGPKAIDSILVPADASWICDVTTANIGETAFFFLEASRVRVEEGSPFRARIDDVFGEHDFLQIAYYGRGRIPVTGDGRTIDPDQGLGWPPGLRDLSRESCGRRKNAYADFIELLETYGRLEQDLSFTASSTPSDSGSLAWSIAVSNDGSCRLLVHSPEKPIEGFPNPRRGRECILHLDPQRLRDLRASLETESFRNLPSDLGAMRPGPDQREMHFVRDGKDVGVRLFAIDPAWMSEPSRREETRRALRVWGKIRGLFEDGACADSRYEDAPWLAEAR